MTDPLIESAKEIEALREKVTSLIRERNEWRDYAINGGNAGYLRIQLAAMTQERDSYKAMVKEQKPRGWWNPKYPTLPVQLTKPHDGGGWEPFYTLP